tara:strand:+ start:313 stop:738 length:426 start_codon:yes stop_codon:yes gene_type:complete
MFSKKVKLRSFFLLIVLLTASIIIYFVFRSLEKNIVYFLSPSDVQNTEDISFNKKIRLGGLVKENSIVYNQSSIDFIITDLKEEIIVTYTGLVPNLFSEGKGVIAEGKLKDKKYFIAEKILAKHDENYMPPEVSESLKLNN